MKTMSKEAENFAMGAVRQLCQMVGAGENPTAALQKVAAEQQLGPNFIRLVANGYNAGAVTYQREKSSGILDKLASFPLADPEAVITALYPAEVATPVQEKNASAVSDAYSRPPRALNKHVLPAVHEKVASMRLDYGEPKPEALPGDPKIAMSKAYGRAQACQQKQAALKLAAAKAQDELLGHLGKCADYFRQWAHDRLSFAEVEYAATHRWGKAASHVLDFVHGRNRSKEKRANGPPARLRPIDWRAEPFTLIEACIKQAAEVNRLRAEYDKGAAELEKQAEDHLRPFSEGPAGATAKTSPNAGEPAEKGASFLGNLLGSAMGTSLGRNVINTSVTPKTPEQLTDSMLGRLSDPQHENDIRQIRAQAMLQELLTTDDVIAGYDPEDVYSAYNELASAMPRGAVQTALVRPLLRKRLTQGSLEPFEAAEMANIEKTISQTQQSGNGKTANVLTSHPILG